MRTLPELPDAVYTAAQVRELDRIAIEELEIPGYRLMCRAGEAALEALLRHWPRARRLAIYCGAGNNAGDGYVLARLAAQHGYAVRVIGVVDPQRLKGDAAQAWQDYVASGRSVEALGEAANRDCDVIVDALLGTGIDRPLTGAFAEAVAGVNRAACPVLALDLPTGLHADSGEVMGEAVRAAATITFVGLKQGLFLGRGPDHRGRLEFSGLNVPAEAYARITAPLRRLTFAELRRALPPRPPSAHKGDSGRLLLIGGAPGTSGAIRMAAEAALRTGAGLVYVGTHEESVASVMAGRPEIMCRALRDADDLSPLVELADAAVLGPGLGRESWGRSLWRAMLATDLPLIVDADGLNLLAETPSERGRWLLTPHPGEAARLLGGTTAAVQSDRLNAARELARRYQASIVLKGVCSLVVSCNPGNAEPAYVCDRGNPGMASAGMGDVLSGVLGALLVQTSDLDLSARAGVLLHALAGDDAATAGQRGTLASDLMPHLRRWANPS